MTELTDKARANLASGATTGPGTDVCAGCDGRKEPTRLNSSRCRRCGMRGKPEVVALRVDLPPAVMDAIRAEAEAKEQTPAERVAYLLTRKYG